MRHWVACGLLSGGGFRFLRFLRVGFVIIFISFVLWWECLDHRIHSSRLSGLLVSGLYGRNRTTVCQQYDIRSWHHSWKSEAEFLFVVEDKLAVLHFCLSWLVPTPSYLYGCCSLITSSLFTVFWRCSLFRHRWHCICSLVILSLNVLCTVNHF